FCDMTPHLLEGRDDGGALGDEATLVGPTSGVAECDHGHVVRLVEARQVRDLVEARPEARVLTRTGGWTVTRPLRMGSTLGADVAQVGGSPRGDRPGIASAVGGVDQYGSAFAIVVVQLLEDGPRLASEGHLAF